MISKGIQFKSIEGHTLFSDTDFGDMGPYFDTEAVSVHAEVVGRVF